MSKSQMREYWKTHRRAIAFLYAASTINLKKGKTGKTLLDGLLARELTYPKAKNKIPQWFANAEWFNQEIIKRLHTGKVKGSESANKPGYLRGGAQKNGGGARAHAPAPATNAKVALFPKVNVNPRQPTLRRSVTTRVKLSEANANIAAADQANVSADLGSDFVPDVADICPAA